MCPSVKPRHKHHGTRHCEDCPADVGSIQDSKVKPMVHASTQITYPDSTIRNLQQNTRHSESDSNSIIRTEYCNTVTNNEVFSGYQLGEVVGFQ
jgi:hypothetical protein